MNRVKIVLSENESNQTAAAPTNASCPKCGGTKPTCCSCSEGSLPSRSRSHRDLVEAVAMPWICVEEIPCEEAVPVHWEEMITALSAMRTPRAEAGLTVEAAVKELREILNSPWCSFQIAVYVQGDEDQWRISSMKLPAIGGASLQECVDQVRAWAKSRVEREGENNADIS